MRAKAVTTGSSARITPAWAGALPPRSTRANPRPDGGSTDPGRTYGFWIGLRSIAAPNAWSDQFGLAGDAAAVEARGVVGRHRPVVVAAVVVHQAHAPDREPHVVQAAEGARHAAGVAAVHDHLAGAGDGRRSRGRSSGGSAGRATAPGSRGGGCCSSARPAPAPMRRTEEAYAGSSACSPPRSAARPVQRCRSAQRFTAAPRAGPDSGRGRPPAAIRAGVQASSTTPSRSTRSDRTPVSGCRLWYQTKLARP